MCNGVCKEKCRVCGERGLSCCRTLPAMTMEEIAKIYFETDAFTESEFSIQSLGGNMYVVLDLRKTHINENNEVDISNEICPFYDQETYECKIYDYRPQVCREFGSNPSLPCPFNDITIEELRNISEDKAEELAKQALLKINVDELLTIKKTSLIDKHFKIIKFKRTDLKNLKYDRLLYFFTAYLDDVSETEESRDKPLLFNVRREYYVVELRNGNNKKQKIGGMRITTWDAKYASLKPIASLYNKLTKRFLNKHIDYLQLVVDDINRKLAGVSDTGLTKAINESKFDGFSDEDKELILKLIYATIFVLNAKNYDIKYVNNYFDTVSDKEARLVIKALSEYLINNDESWLNKQAEDVRLFDLITGAVEHPVIVALFDDIERRLRALTQDYGKKKRKLVRA